MTDHKELLYDAETVARRSNKNGDTRRIENLATALAESDAENTELRKVIAQVSETFNLQCAREPERADYIDDGAYFAHHWWWTVLGPVLSAYPSKEDGR